MIELQRITPRIGARIEGIDLSAPLSADNERTLRQAFDDHHLLVFPDQATLSIDDQVGLLARFGPVLEERVPGEKHSFVSNADGRGTDEMNAGYREGELTAHMDYTYTPYPADAISLYCLDLPESGSTTRFFSNVAPLAEMPTELREEIAHYTIFCAHDLAQMKPDARLYREPRTDPAAPTQSHVWPLIRPHPHKPGIEIMSCCLQQTERIVELSDPRCDDAKSRALLGRIFDDYLYTRENAYDHRWRIGDLVLWDNLALQHAREACPLTSGARSFRRVAVCAAGNAIHDTVRFLDLADSSVAFS